MPTMAVYWLRCTEPQTSTYTTVPSGCVAIPGARSLSYVSTSADVGKHLTVQVAGNSPRGFALAGALSVGPVEVDAPKNVTPPVVSGTPQAGSTLTLDVGTWSGSPAPTIAIYWLRCGAVQSSVFTTVPPGCVAIAGAHSTTYTAGVQDIGKHLTAQVAGNSTLGFALAGAISTAAVAPPPSAAPANLTPPTVTGTAEVGAVWTVDVGTWSGSPAPTTVVYWLRCNQPQNAVFTTVPAGCTPIPGSTGATHTIADADAGKYITAQVAGNSVLGFALAGAISTTVIPAPASTAPANLTSPTVSGSATVGSTWTVDPGTWSGSPAPTLALYWLRCTQPQTAVYTTVPTGCEPIPGARSTSYVATASDAGRYLTVQVAGNAPTGFALAGAISTQQIVHASPAPPANVTPPTVSGNPVVGATWTVDTGTWSGVPAPTILVFWLRCTQPQSAVYTTVPAGCTPIPGATSTSYVAVASDAGKYLTAQVAGNAPAAFALAGAISTAPIR